MKRILLTVMLAVLPLAAQLRVFQPTDKFSTTNLNYNFSWLNTRKAGIGSCPTGWFAVGTSATGVVCLPVPVAHNAGAWLLTATYDVNAIITYNGGSYIATLPGSGHTPDLSPAYWVPLGSSVGESGTGGSGTVGSVGLTVPAWLAVTGSPVVSSGTLAITTADSQTSHQVIGTCGAGTAFGPCLLTLQDLPASVLNTGTSYTNPTWLSLSWTGGRISGIPSVFAPTAHAGAHASNGSDPIAPASIGAQAALGYTPVSLSGNYTDPAWLSLNWGGGRISGIPATFAPSLHAGAHATGGGDPITPSSIGAQPALGFTPVSTSGAYTNPTWLSLSWTGGRISGIPSTFAPTAHASTHGSGQSDPINVAESQVTNLATDLAGKQAAISGAPGAWPSAFTPSGHGLLSSYHSDTTAGTAARGDILTGQGASATWTRLAKGSTGTYLRSNGTDVLYSTIQSGDLPAATISTAGVVTTTTATTQVVSTDDTRMTNARTPTAHAATHAAAGTDPLTLTEAQIASLVTDLAAKQAAIVTGTTTQYFRGDLSLAAFPTTWAWESLTGVPSTFTPAAHAATHAGGGSDPLSMWGTGTRPVAASALGTAGDCVQWTTSGIGGTGSPCGSGAGGGANALGQYVVTSATNAPANAINLGSLSTGLFKLSVATGTATPSIATAGIDYQAAITGAPGAWPSFSAVATSGSYTDLVNKPAIPAAQVNSDWTAVSGLPQILNKPTSWAWGSLSGVPSTFAPSLHAAAHASGGGDPITVTESQVTSLVADLSGKQATITGAPGSWPATFAPSTHALLGSSHSDVTVGTVARGDVITGQGASATWTRLAKGSTGTYLRSNGTDVLYSAIQSGDLPAATTSTAGAVTTTTTTTQAVSTDDNRMTNARTPTVHASTHAGAGSDPVTLAESQITNLSTDLGGKQATITGAPTTWPSFSVVATSGSYTDLLDKPATWPWANLSGVPSTFAPSTHAATHVSAGVDPLTLAESQITNLTTDLSGKQATITGAPASWPTTFTAAVHNLLSATHGDVTAGTVARGDLVTGQGVSPTWTRLARGSTGTYLRSNGTDVLYSTIQSGDMPAATASTAGAVTTTTATAQVVSTDDSRMTNARTPTVHASTHVAAGSDPLTLTEAQVTNLATDLSGKQAAITGAPGVWPSFATVATSGSYSDLSNKPTIPAAQVQTDWTAVSGMGQLLNKPVLATVATSGSYTDLSGKPTIPAAQVQTDWTAISGMGQILNKPATFPPVTSGDWAGTWQTHALGYFQTAITGAPTTWPSFSTVATSGSYPDLLNKPTIPAAQVNSDWSAVSGLAQILNKPVTWAWGSLTGVPGSFNPAAHASTHASNGTDSLTLAESQITNLATDLAAKQAAITGFIQNADGSASFGKAVNWAAASIPTVNAGGTTTCDMSLSNLCQLTLTGDTALNIVNADGTGPYKLRFIQDATAGRKITGWPANSRGQVDPSLGTAANDFVEQDFTYDGTHFNFGTSVCPSCNTNAVVFPEGVLRADGTRGTLVFTPTGSSSAYMMPLTASATGQLASTDLGDTSSLVRKTDTATVTNTMLANAAMTINGTACTLGSSCAPAGGGGDAVTVNSTVVTNPVFNGTTPAAPTGFINGTFQVSGSNVSVAIPSGSDSHAFAGAPTWIRLGSDHNLGTCSLVWTTYDTTGAQYKDVKPNDYNCNPSTFDVTVTWATAQAGLLTLVKNGGGGTSPSGSGTVQSVGLTMPSWFSVAGGPVTSTGTLAVTPATAQTSHQVIGTCNSATTFGPCALTSGDIPALNYQAPITGAPTAWPTFATIATSGSYTDLLNKPTTFAPIAHASAHAAGSSDPVTLTEAQVTNLTTDLSGKQATITGAPGSWPATFTPATHAASHLSNGGDAIAAASTTVRGTVLTTTETATAVSTDDTRMSNARTPTAHATTHAAGAGDPVTLTEAQITGLTTDLSGKQGTITGAPGSWPTTFAPAAHASTHLSNGADAIAAATASVRGTVTTTTATSQVVSTDDTRLATTVWKATNTSVVTSATNNTTEQNLQAVTITAGTLNAAGKTLKVRAYAKHTTGSTGAGTLTYKVKLCSVSGCASGTVITLATWTTGTNTSSSTNAPDTIDLIATTVATGATGTMEAHGRLDSVLAVSTTTPPTAYYDANVAVSTAFDMTAAWFLQVTVTASVNGTGNTTDQVAHRLLVAEVI